jgi:uncharacterized glyoxalase superfamily protein PhnB
MRSNRSMPEASVIPELAYKDVPEAVAWLCEAFGFQERLRIGNHRAQLTFGKGALVVTQRETKTDASPRESLSPGSPSRGETTHSIMVRVKGLDRHYGHAVQHGARIIHPPADYPYGERQYTVEDPGGHIWTFSETIADVDPASWGGRLVGQA